MAKGKGKLKGNHANALHHFCVFGGYTLLGAGVKLGAWLETAAPNSASEPC